MHPLRPTSGNDTIHASADRSSSLVPATVAQRTLSGMPVELIDHIFSFDPDSASTMQAVSRTLQRIGASFLSSQAGEIDALYSAEHSTLYSLIHDRWMHFQPQFASQPSALVGFYRSVPECIRSLGVSQCRHNAILSPQEIAQYNHRIEDENLNKIWGVIGREALIVTIALQGILPEDEARALNPPGLEAVVMPHFSVIQRVFQGIPFDTAPSAQDIRHWMRAEENQPILQGFHRVDLERLQLTCVPLEVRLCTGMRHLSLSRNHLTFIPDRFFSTLVALETLNLSENQLLSTPEHLFDGLVSLQALDLAKNRLTCVPQAIRLCTGVRHLSLRGNHITFLPDRSFNTLVALETLDLSDNQLRSTPEHPFDGLLSLRALDLANNRLTSLPEGVFRGLSALRMLYLGDSSSHSLPHRLINGTGWRVYDPPSSGNSFVSLPRGLFDGLNRLQTLALPTNPELMICLDGLTSPGLLEGYTRMEFNGVTFEERLHPNHIPFLGMMRTFYSYACESPLARVYQLVADSHPREDIQNAFSQLPKAMRNALFGWVWVEAGSPDVVDRQWGGTHAFDDMQILGRALKQYVRESFDTLSVDQRNAVYGHVYDLARREPGAENVNFDSPQWGEEHAQEHILRLLDALVRLQLPHIDPPTRQ